MKKITIALTVLLTITSNTAFAVGGKVKPPVTAFKSNFVELNVGGKVKPPVVNVGGKVKPPVLSVGGKVKPPVLNVGGKVKPPASNIVAQDSGAFSLSDIFSKYFSF